MRADTLGQRALLPFKGVSFSLAFGDSPLMFPDLSTKHTHTHLLDLLALTLFPVLVAKI